MDIHVHPFSKIKAVANNVHYRIDDFVTCVKWYKAIKLDKAREKLGKTRLMPLRRDRFKERREAMGISQAELAIRTGLSKRMIGRYEQGGQGEPTADALARICKELNVSADYLLGLADAPNAIMPDVDPEARLFFERFRKLPKNIRDLILGLVFGEK